MEYYIGTDSEWKSYWVSHWELMDTLQTLHLKQSQKKHDCSQHRHASNIWVVRVPHYLSRSWYMRMFLKTWLLRTSRFWGQDDDVLQSSGYRTGMWEHKGCKDGRQVRVPLQSMLHRLQHPGHEHSLPALKILNRKSLGLHRGRSHIGLLISS